jgi:hypothetical protein
MTWTSLVRVADSAQVLARDAKCELGAGLVLAQLPKDWTGVQPIGCNPAVRLFVERDRRSSRASRLDPAGWGLEAA